MLQDNSKEIESILGQAVDDRVFPGCVYGVIDNFGKEKVFATGSFTYDIASPKVDENTIYDIASMTKVLPIASLALMLIDRGQISPDDLLIDYLPEFNNPDREKITVRQMLSYSSGGYGTASMSPTRNVQELFDMFMTKPFDFPNGVCKYSNVPTILLGFMIEKITSKSLKTLADENILSLLKMSDTTFDPNLFEIDWIAPTERDVPVENYFYPDRLPVHGFVHDETAWKFKKFANRDLGCAGIFSTTPDLLKFCKSVMTDYIDDTNTLFSKKILEETFKNQVKEGEPFGMGFEIGDLPWVSFKNSKKTISKTGFTGCRMIIDLEKGISSVLLSNRVYPKRPTDSSAINNLSKKLSDIVFNV